MMTEDPMHLIGLLGYPLGHSFSAEYFREKFRKLGFADWDYRLLERKELSDFKKVIQEDPRWHGFNVTIPHKTTILPLLDSTDPLAARIGAVNVVKILPGGSWRGFNSDYDGFRKSLQNWQPESFWRGKTALILGSGGASRAVKTVLADIEMEAEMVARKPADYELSWQQLTTAKCRNSDLIVQCTPLGMAPDTSAVPPLPDDAFRPGQYVIDLIYNPGQTEFLRRALSAGATIQNGMPMLVAQAEKAWEIWTDS